jgi:hypothetical protein
VLLTGIGCVLATIALDSVETAAGAATQSPPGCSRAPFDGRGYDYDEPDRLALSTPEKALRSTLNVCVQQTASDQLAAFGYDTTARVTTATHFVATESALGVLVRVRLRVRLVSLSQTVRRNVSKTFASVMKSSRR